MWKKLLESFEPLQHEDPHFGLVEFQENEQDKTYFLMKDLSIGQPEINIALTVETKDKVSTDAQFALFKLITSNFPGVIQQAYQFFQKHGENSSVEQLKERYEVDSIYIDQDRAGNRWELTLRANEEAGGYCVIDFDGLKPVLVTIEE
jgi:hypothetical protein